MATNQISSDKKISIKDLDMAVIRTIVKESVAEAIGQLSRSNLHANSGSSTEKNNAIEQQPNNRSGDTQSEGVTQYLGLVRGATQQIRGQPLLKDSDGRHVHMSIYCDICNEQISGARYKCVVCHDYDLCSSCKTASNHPEDHPLLILNRPLWDKSRITIESEIYQQPDLTTNIIESTTNIIDCPYKCSSKTDTEQQPEKKEYWQKSRSRACPALRQINSLSTRQSMRAIGPFRYRVPLEPLICDDKLQGTNFKRAFFAKDYMAGGMSYVSNLTANPPPCSKVYTSTLNGIDSGRICYHRFSIKNETAVTWTLMSLQMRRVFQTYLTIIKNIYIDWSIPKKVKPGDYADVEIVYELDNVDSVFSSRNSFQQEWLLKDGPTYLADINCIMHFERPMSKKFCPDTQIGSTDPVPSTSSSHLTDEAAPSINDNKTEVTWDRYEVERNSELRELRDSFEKNRAPFIIKFKPPGTTPTSTPAGAMSPKSLDLVATALDVTPSKTDDSSELEQSAGIQKEEELLICDTTDTIPVQNSEKCSDGPITASTNLTIADPNVTNSTENSETKSESFFFLQPEEAKTSIEAKTNTSDRKVESNAPTRTKANVVATIRRSLTALKLGKENSNSSSIEDLSSDFVVVKLPSCFDLDVPFKVDKDDDQVLNAPPPSILDAVPWPKWDGPFIKPAINEVPPTDAKLDNLACELADPTPDSYAGTSMIDQPINLQNLSSHTELSKPVSDSADDNSGKSILSSPIKSQPCPNTPLYPNLESFEIEASKQQPAPSPPKAYKKLSSLQSFIATPWSDDESESSSYDVDDVYVSDEDSGRKVWSKVKKSQQDTVQTRQPTVANTVNTIELPQDLTPDSPETSKMLHNLSILSEMGFNDRETNGSLLLKYNQDLGKVLIELLGESA